MNKIKNKAEFEVNFCGRTHVVASEVSIVEPIKVEIEQEMPCRYVLENETIRYVFKVKNLSNTDIYNCKFRNNLSNDVTYVQGSFQINGNNACANLNGNVLEASISELRGCQTLIVSFEARVGNFVSTCNNNTCPNNPNPCPNSSSTFVHGNQI